ncbi:hypothetical protein O6H91_08G050200 [Diphasiastrum complanatum]|uniref:Uncharacterized protein n=2 Tax=Diphasiastrum complanatum TaxID=34168 RepID=A0ACC2CXD0_DIPCM|nr:hypothetical protein O6H91_08G050200 [Diphasiastrum complanatum]KAJ7546676.1 hypothetical protein O6H91_08G050200 [Diphasiastrum complanatum]
MMVEAPVMHHYSDFWGNSSSACRGTADREASGCFAHPHDDCASSSYVLIIVNCRLPDFTASLWTKARLHVCADGGANRLYHELPKLFQSEDASTVRERFIPDAIIGDLDSIDPDVREFYTCKGTTVLDKSDDQDTTDLHKCVAFIESSTPDLRSPNLKLIVVGALGGRFDHELANINVLYSFPSLRIVLLSDSTMLLLLPRGFRHEIKVNSSIEGPHCGLIPVGAPSETTTTTGLKWNLDRTAMAFGSLISTCNLVQSQIVTVCSDADLLWTITIHEAKYS